MRKLHTGQVYSKKIIVTDKMGERYAELTGDYNAIHLQDDFAENTIFHGKIVHGMLVAGFISGIIGNDFPGQGTIYLKQDLEFCHPVRYHDEIDINIRVLDIVNKKVSLETNCVNQNGITCIKGTALVKVLSKK